MSSPLRFLVAESETPSAREARRARVGRSSGETYVDTLRSWEPTARFDLVHSTETGADTPCRDPLEAFDGVFITGSPLHLYDDTPEVQRQLAFMRAVFASGTPCFGSCAGLQVAAVAAGGAVRDNRAGHETPFARRITPTQDGRAHPLLAGRPLAYDALAVHSDEVERLPDGATLLATNGVTPVQAAEIRHGGGVFWGVQYHPELPIGEIAGALGAQADDVVEQGLAPDRPTVERYAETMLQLSDSPDRRDLAWLLGIDEQITDPARRTIELRNFIDHLVRPVRITRLRD